LTLNYKSITIIIVLDRRISLLRFASGRGGMADALG